MVPLTAFVIYLNSNCFIINQIIELVAISIIVGVLLSQFYVQLNRTHLGADSPASKRVRIIEEAQGLLRPSQG